MLVSGGRAGMPERRLAVGFGRTATREVRAGTGRPRKLSSVRETPVTDPAVAKGFGGQGRRSAHHRRGPLAVSLFTVQPFTSFLRERREHKENYEL